MSNLGNVVSSFYKDRRPFRWAENHARLNLKKEVVSLKASTVTPSDQHILLSGLSILQYCRSAIPPGCWCVSVRVALRGLRQFDNAISSLYQGYSTFRRDSGA